MSEQNVIDTPQQHAAADFDGNNSNSGDGDFEGGFDGDSGGNDSDGGDASTPPGMGQSKSSRRRRRKRKNKVAGPEGSAAPAGGEEAEGGSAPAPMVMEGESLALAASAQQQPRKQQTAQPQGQNNGGGQPQGGQQQQQPGQGQGKRWKKKFRDRERRPGGTGGGRSENPGNDFRGDINAAGSSAPNNGGYRTDNFGNGGGFKRKGKSGGGQGQRRERGGFVGPMDHSYREVNGNGSEGPPSTIQMHGRNGHRGQRHHGDSQPIDHSMPRAVPIPEDAQTHIYFFIEELFFIAKIQESARKLGVKIEFVKADNKEALAALMSGDDANKPALIVFDLNNANAKPLTLIPKLKAKLKRSVSVIGFLSHLQGDLKAKAVEAGCDTVMPRSAFSQNLPNLLRRYGVEEVEEVNFNY